MATYFVATMSRYVLVDAADEAEAREKGYAALYELFADLRRQLGGEFPIEIQTIRPAAADEIELWNWHHEMLAREAAIAQR